MMFVFLKKKVAAHYIIALAIIATTAYLCTPLANTQNYHLVSFILLFVVSFLSTFMGIGPILLASTFSAIVWNYFFIPPHYTFKIDKTEDVLIFGLFFIIALVNGVLTTQVRKQEALARSREKRTNALYELTKMLSQASSISEIVQISKAKIKEHFFVDAVFFLQQQQSLLNSSALLQMPEEPISKQEYQEAQEFFSSLDRQGDRVRIDTNYYFLLSGNQIHPGMIMVKNGVELPRHQESLWGTFLVQISNALEREFLGELAQKARLLDESDRLYKTLFNSISHELRIPVATIMAASDSLIHANNTSDLQYALSQEIVTATIRLNRVIDNLLNISRIESGHISLSLDWYDINDLIYKVSTDLKDDLKGFSVRVNIPKSMPPVFIDFGLIEQVLYNLLYNATQYATKGTTITVETGIEDKDLIIVIKDQGPGFPQEALTRAFDKFYRGDYQKTGGLGLGLSIVKGFVEAHNGSVIVTNNIKGGACFRILLPAKKTKLYDSEKDNINCG